MIFDRSAITKGRKIQDFGLCDTNGVYQITTKLRAKGWLVLAFFSPDEGSAGKLVDTLQEWSTTLPSANLSVVGVYRGDKSSITAFAQQHALTFPVLWDYDDNNIQSWGLTALPTTFVIDAAGSVVAKIFGDDSVALASAKSCLEVAIQRAIEAARVAAEAAEAAKTAAANAPTAPAPAPATAAPEQAKTASDKSTVKSASKSNQ